MELKKNAFVFTLSLLLMSNAPIRFHQDINSQQYVFKAAFLFRFIEYIEWKKNSKSATFNFAVLGHSPITEQMLIIAAEEKINKKKIKVAEYETIDEPDSYNILFVSKNSPVPIEDVVSKFAGKPVLIVAEKEGYASKGAHINFFISDNKLKFEINQKAASKAGIKISSQLLRHAVIVNYE
ncbi:MAG: YfiR family protein [Bacteroidota bacterium]